MKVTSPQDIADLFGSDLPVEGKPGWCFQWRDGPFLKALKSGDWIMLDEVRNDGAGEGVSDNLWLLLCTDESCISVSAGRIECLFGSQGRG